MIDPPPTAARDAYERLQLRLCDQCGLSRRACLIGLNCNDGKCCDQCTHPWGKP